MKRSVIMFVLLPAFIFAQQKENVLTIANPLFDSIKDSIIKQINRGAIPSFSVAVSRKGKVIWMQSYGWADKKKKIKATPSTSYPLASLSKSITATALMVLVQRGKVHLDDPVDKFLGKIKLTYYQKGSTPVLLRHLTNMMGGIPHQFEYFYADEKQMPLTIQEQVRRYGIVVFPPGTVFNYSNFSPGILELVIENCSHQRFSSFMEKEIFHPLAMKNAAVYRSGLKEKEVAAGYDDKGNVLASSEFYPKGGAGYYASISDLIHYGMFHLNDKIKAMAPVLGQQYIKQLHEAGDLPGYNKFYSNGWGVLNPGAGEYSLLSNGAIDGVASSLLLLPEQDIAIACLTNATVGNEFTDNLAFDIANTLLPGYRKDMESFMEKNEEAFSDKPFKATDSLEGVWKGYIHTYNDSAGVQMTIERNGQIRIRIQDQFETILNNVSMSNGLINGQSYGFLSLPEVSCIPYYLEFVLKFNSDEFYGSVSAQSAFTQRPYFLIPGYISLRKIKVGQKEKEASKEDKK